MAPDVSGPLAELSVIADHVERQRDRVGGLVDPFLGTERDDVIIALHEAERQLAIASRTLRRAIKALET